MLRNLSSLNEAELRAFLDSFDDVLCDCDGVLWNYYEALPGANKTISKLKEHGKRVRLVSNNSVFPKEKYGERLKKYHFDLTVDELCTPTLAIIDYLHSISFDKEILIFGTPSVQKQFTDAGLKVAEVNGKLEGRAEALEEILADDDKIGAVVVETDIDVFYAKIMKACVVLKHPEVLYIISGGDKVLHLNKDKPFMGPHYFHSIITNYTSRAPMEFGKPGRYCEKYVTKKFNIKDPSRTLFVGDTLDQDMAFAAKCGYKKLLVLTGIATLDEAKKCSVPQWVPDYYVDSMSDVCELIESKLKS